MKKLFLSDIDGTILKTGYDIHPAVAPALMEFTENGGFFGLSTGRHLSAIKEIAARLPITAPCILCGGAMIYDLQNNSPLFTKTFDKNVFSFISNVLQRYSDVSVTVCTSQSIFNLRLNDVLLDRGVYEDRTAPLVSFDDIKDFDLIKVLLTCRDTDKLKEIGREYVDHNNSVYHAASRRFYELTPLNCNKGIAAQFIHNHFGGEAECVLYTAGDSDSDLSMKPVSSCFFVPETAADHVKSQASVIIPSPFDGGIAVAIKHITGDS